MRYCFLFLALLVFACRSARIPAAINADPYNYTIDKQAHGNRGAVVSAHPLATAVGLQVLKKGGNAFDAAIATQLALAVVYPAAGNIGGGGFMVARKSNGELISLDYREKAPSAAHRDMYLDASGAVIPGASTEGHLSCGVPGTVAGLFQTLQHARLPFRVLIQPAIDLARGGFAITSREASLLNNIQASLSRYNTSPNAFQKNSPWKAGDTLKQEDLAHTLERIQSHGLPGFYAGETATKIVEEMKRGKGLITLADLQNYEAKWRTPHRFFYKGYEIVSMPPPSSGGILLHQMLAMVEHRPLAQYGYGTAAAVQLMTEVERRAFADRSVHLGDADFYPVSSVLTDSAYLSGRMKDYQPMKAGTSKNVKAGVLPIISEQTTHLSIVDGDGNAVAVTTTLNNAYGSKTVVGGAGFFLNDEMDDFSSKPGVPNMYGAIGGVANAIEANKRMLSAMTPTVVLKEGKPFLIAGTPGGTTIPTSLFQTLVNVIDFGMTTDDAVNKPKFHHQWLPDLIDVEAGFPQALRDSLQAMGYSIRQRSPIGRTELIRVSPNGRLEAVADSRGDDAAAAW